MNSTTNEETASEEPDVHGNPGQVIELEHEEKEYDLERLGMRFRHLNPRHSEKEIDELKASLIQDVQKSPIIVDENQDILDGFGRYEALTQMDASGLLPFIPVIEVKDGLTEEEKHTYLFTVNTEWRYLDMKAKKDRAKAYLLLNSELSNRHIGTQVKLSHPVVASIRRDLECTGEINLPPFTSQRPKP